MNALKKSLEKIVAQEVRIDKKEYINEILPFDKDEYKNIAMIQELRNIYKEELDKIETYIRRYLQPIISYPGTPRGDNVDQLETIKQSYRFLKIQVSENFPEIIVEYKTEKISDITDMKKWILDRLKNYFITNIRKEKGKIVYKKQNGGIFEIMNDNGENIQVGIPDTEVEKKNIYYVNINGKNVMVLKYFEKKNKENSKENKEKIFSKENIKELIPEIVPNNEIEGIGVLDLFVDEGQNVGFILLPCVPILNDKIQEVLTYKERRKYVKGFIKYFLSMMKSK